MLVAKSGIHPPQGYFFEEIDKSIHRGRSWPEVERKIIKYRKINRFPPGEPLKEIIEQAAQRNPELFWNKRVRGGE